MQIRTERLTLRSWRPEDLAPFATQCADPRVMAYFERPWPAEEAEAAIARYRRREAAHGFCMWAAELTATGALAGVIGLQHVTFEAPFTPAVEVGWRLAPEYWGKGLATEGARAAIAHGFGRGLPEIVAMAVPANHRSLAVMRRLGMRRDLDADFDHPHVAAGHPYRRHCLHRLQAPA